MRAIIIITSLFLASCITTLKPPTPNNDRQPLSEATISKLNGDYDVQSKKSYNITLDFALTFDKDPNLTKVTIETIDGKHIRAKLYNRDSLIISRIIKGKIKDDYFVFTRRNVSPFWFIINGFGKKTARLGVLNNGDLIADSRHVIVGTIIILPFTGGREQVYDLIFTKQIGSR